MISGKCDFIDISAMRLVCQQALKNYFIFCIVFQSLKMTKKKDKLRFWKRELESFEENKNTFVNNSIQNRKMYIQK